MTTDQDNEDARLDALDHHAGWCACRAKGWLDDAPAEDPAVTERLLDVEGSPHP